MSLFSFISDKTAPTAEMTSASTTTYGLTSLQVTLRASESVVAPLNSQFTVVGGTVSSVTPVAGSNGLLYRITVTVTDSNNGLTITLGAGVLKDLAGNGTASQIQLILSPWADG